MTLSIANKTYLKVQPACLETRLSLASLKDALKAFESENKKRCISALYKAYRFLPYSDMGLKVTADIMESLLQIEAYQEAAQVALETEKQYYCHYLSDASAHFELFRIYSNAIEAHEALDNRSQVRHYSRLAMDEQLELDEGMDLDIVLQMMKKAD